MTVSSIVQVEFVTPTDPGISESLVGWLNCFCQHLSRAIRGIVIVTAAIIGRPNRTSSELDHALLL